MYQVGINKGTRVPVTLLGGEENLFSESDGSYYSMQSYRLRLERL